jgi:hypothetical protein
VRRFTVESSPSDSIRDTVKQSLPTSSLSLYCSVTVSGGIISVISPALIFEVLVLTGAFKVSVLFTISVLVLGDGFPAWRGWPSLRLREGRFVATRSGASYVTVPAIPDSSYDIELAASHQFRISFFARYPDFTFGAQLCTLSAHYLQPTVVVITVRSFLLGRSASDACSTTLSSSRVVNRFCDHCESGT